MTEAVLATFAHDVRTPLTGILALSELMAASELGERERRWAMTLKGTAEHLAALTTLIVDAAKAGVHRLEPTREFFDPSRLAEIVAASLAARAEAKGLGCHAAIAGDFPRGALGDPVRLRAALENIIDNAVKFTDRGEITMMVEAERASNDRVRLVFTVKDDGIGMTKAEIGRLMRPFAQASAEIARRYGGAGLGLSLVNRLAQAMGGKLVIESKPGRGSTFQLGVMVEKAPARAVAIGAAVAGSPGRITAPERAYSILCVEDNPYGRVVMNTILGELGHKAEFVGSGEAAVEAVGRGTFDLVLMDVKLSGLDGLEATRRIRALPAPAGRIPIVGVTGRGEANDEVAARAAGMDGYLRKPVSPRALASIMAQFAPR